MRNPEAHATYMRAWRANNRERARTIARRGNRTYRLRHPERHLDNVHRYDNKAREELMEFFGGCCAKCGFSDIRALQLDHRDGGGRREHLHLHDKLRLIRERPDEARRRFQLLCANCNWIKRVENREYGSGRPKTVAVA